MSKHFLVGLKLSDVKKMWGELQRLLEEDPPMYADPHTPLYAISPPDESTVRVLLYRSSNATSGLRIGHAQKSEALTPEWSFAYRYLERKGKTVVAYRGSLKLAFRSIQRLRAESSLYYIFVQFQQLSSNDRSLEMINIDTTYPIGRYPIYDDWINPGVGYLPMNSMRRFHGFVGLCVEDNQANTYNETEKNDNECCSLYESNIVTCEQSELLNQYYSSANELTGAAPYAPPPPWSIRFVEQPVPAPELVSLNNHLLEYSQMYTNDQAFSTEYGLTDARMFDPAANSLMI